MAQGRLFGPGGLPPIGRVTTFAVLDMLIAFTAYTATFAIRVMGSPFGYVLGLQLIAVAAVVTPVTLYTFGVYHRIWERTSGHGIAVIIKAVAAMTALISAINLAVVPRPLPFSVILVSNALAFGGFVTIRYRSRLLSGVSWRWRAIWYQEFPQPTTRVLIVGAGEAGQTLALRLKHRFPSKDYTVVGFVDDDPKKRNMYVEGCKVLGSRTSIPRLVDELRIDLIVMAIHNLSGPDLHDILRYCEKTTARIKVIPDVLALMSAKNGHALLRDVQLEDLIGRSTVSRHEAVDFTPIMRKTILVTGAAGSIGSELCRQLITYHPATLLLLDNNESDLFELELELRAKCPDARLEPVLADITHCEELDRVFELYHPPVIFHAAAYKHVPMLECYPREAVRVNIVGTQILGKLAMEYGAERFVLISTDKAVNPTSVMGASKRVCELLLHSCSQQNGHHTMFTSVRFGNVLGSRGSVVPIFSRQIDRGGPVTITHPRMTRYFMSIAEAANLVIHAACLTDGGDIFVLKMGEAVRIVDLAERMIRLRGLRPGVDIELQFTGVRPGEKLDEELYDSTETLIKTVHPDIIKAKNNNSFVDRSVFFEQLDRLVTTVPCGAPDTLQQLLKLVNLNSHH